MFKKTNPHFLPNKFLVQLIISTLESGGVPSRFYECRAVSIRLIQQLSDHFSARYTESFSEIRQKWLWHKFENEFMEQKLSPLHQIKCYFIWDSEKVSHTWYLSQTPQTPSVEKNRSCGEISDFYTSVMGRNLEFLHMWFNFKFLHMTDVEKFDISSTVCLIYGILLHFTLFCSKIWPFFLAIYAVLSQNWFVAIYALLCGENFSQK